ncbi:MAG: hypothetical protein VX529_06435 [Pseudomonadota bacterium]|nr:hypothetical protein [Pseudomonadota bacterium]
MAGSPAKAKRYDELTERADKAEAEVTRLRQLMAVHGIDDPDGPAVAVNPVTQYSADICKRVVAMGQEGMGEAEWIAALGLSADTWDTWNRQHEELASAARQAHAAMKAYWQGEQRRAMAANNSRFPINVAREMMGQELRGSGGDKGDASKLVLLDLNLDRCPHCETALT